MADSLGFEETVKAKSRRSSQQSFAHVASSKVDAEHGWHVVRSNEDWTQTTNSVAIVPPKGTFVSAIEGHKPINALSIRVKEFEAETSEQSGSKRIEFTQDTQSIFVTRDSLPVNVRLSQEQP